MSASRDISPQHLSRKRPRSQPGRHNTGYGRPLRKEIKTKKETVISVLLSILTAAVLCIFIGLMLLRTADIPHITKNILNEINIGALIEEIDDTRYLLDQINSLPINNNTITYPCLDIFFKLENVAHEFGIVMERYMNAFAFGDFDYHITIDDIIDHSLNIEPELSWFFIRELSYEDNEYLAIVLDDILDLSSLSVDGIAEDFGINFTTPRLLLSLTTFWLTGFIFAGLLMVVIFINKRNLPVAFIYAGVSIALSGLIVFITGLWFEASSLSLIESGDLMLIFLEGSIGSMSQYGFTFAAVGVLIFAVSFSIFRASERNLKHIRR